MITRQRALRAILRCDLTTFIHRAFLTVSPSQAYEHNWHIEALAHHLTQCLDGGIRRLVITLPPRSLKSICASVAFPAWALGRDPGLRFVCASYSQDLAAKHARDCRAVMTSPWYRDAFPWTRIDPAKSGEAEFETTAKGYRLATSVGGTLTGRGGSIIVIDDPMKPVDVLSDVKREAVKDWYDGTLYSRLDNKKAGAIILIMQRLHVDDLVGHVLNKEAWTHLNLPAIASSPSTIPIGLNRVHHWQEGNLLHPQREPLAVLEGLKASMGSQAYSAQYLQAPVPPGGALIKWEWFRRYRGPPMPQSGDRIVQSWDTASKAGELNDYSVCTTWRLRGSDYYLTDVFRDRLEFPELRRAVLAQARAHGVSTILIEDAGSGTHLIQDLRRSSQLRPIGCRPEADKITRVAAQSALIEAGHVHVPETALWLEAFQTEVMQFPFGRHDDQVDSLSQLLSWVELGRQTRFCVGKLTGW